MFDISLFGIAAVLLVGLIAPEVLKKSSPLLLSMAILFFWIFVETFLLSQFGTTPGKWLFRIRLHIAGATTIPFAAALSRSFKVWLRGLGLGIPIVSLFTLVTAYYLLKGNSQTSWDRQEGFVVIHDEAGIMRLLAAVVFFVGFTGLVVTGIVAN